MRRDGCELLPGATCETSDTKVGMKISAFPEKVKNFLLNKVRIERDQNRVNWKKYDSM